MKFFGPKILEWISDKRQKFLKWISDKIEKDEAKNEVHNFLPGIDSVINKPLPLSFWVLPLSLGVFVLIIFLWLWLSKVDVVSPAQGSLLPGSRVKIIQPKNVNVVEEIYVSEGDFVEEGDKLVSFSATEEQLDLEKIAQQKKDVELKRIEILSFRDFLLRRRNETFKIRAKDLNFDLDDLEVKEQLQSYRSRVRSFRAKYQIEVSRKRGLLGNQRKILLQIKKMKNELAYQKKRLDRSKQLFRSSFLSQEDFEKEEELTFVKDTDKEILRQELFMINSDLRSSTQELILMEEEAKLQSAAELAELDKELDELKNQLGKEEDLFANKILRSPIDGIVNNLAIHTVGGVVQSGDIVMRIVPEKEKLEVEVKVLNKDIGFIEVGQSVDVKIDAFNFTKYGAISGMVAKIADFSIVDEVLGPIFKVIVRLDKSTMLVDGKEVRLKPGMTATVDVKIGKRRLLETIFSPLLRYKSEALREK